MKVYEDIYHLLLDNICKDLLLTAYHNLSMLIAVFLLSLLDPRSRKKKEDAQRALQLGMSS